MVEESETAGSHVMELFDAQTDQRVLVCRVCGALVAAGGEYPKAHWDWHEATNGA